MGVCIHSVYALCVHVPTNHSYLNIPLNVVVPVALSPGINAFQAMGLGSSISLIAWGWVLISRGLGKVFLYPPAVRHAELCYAGSIQAALPQT